MKYTLHYATNRNHKFFEQTPEGSRNRWNPDYYGKKFSSDDRHNLRFGAINVEADVKKITGFLEEDAGSIGIGDGSNLSKYFAEQAKKDSKIDAFDEYIEGFTDGVGSTKKLGSIKMFRFLKDKMVREEVDVLIYIHGFDTSWFDAVGNALALKEILNSKGKTSNEVEVVLFTWPSDGKLLAYKADRRDVDDSGEAFARGLLKLRDFLIDLQEKSRRGEAKLCRRNLHLLCHSMGNYMLQSTLKYMCEFRDRYKSISKDDPFANYLCVPYLPRLPLMFENAFLCAADVDDDCLEKKQPLGELHKISRNTTIYYSPHDRALDASVLFKGNQTRLGEAGTARPNMVHKSVCQIDCSRVDRTFFEHGYYLMGNVAEDIKYTIDGVPQDALPESGQEFYRKRRTGKNGHKDWVLLEHE